MLSCFRRSQHFVPPPEAVYRAPDLEFMNGYHSYGEYNYLRPGLVSRIKAAHFEMALELTREHFSRCSVIDFGCADGVFLPSLAKHFESAVGVDQVPMFAEIARRVVEEIGADNVQVICNEGLDVDELRMRMPEGPYRIAYCLEVIEHAGEPGDLYGSKLRVLHQIFSLLEEEGLIVLSVPTMVGIPFLIQRVALATLGIWRERISLKNLLKASFLKDTSDLEREWDGGHLGFNHLRLEERMRGEFQIRRRVGIGFQRLYVIGRC